MTLSPSPDGRHGRHARTVSAPAAPCSEPKKRERASSFESARKTEPEAVDLLPSLTTKAEPQHPETVVPEGDIQAFHELAMKEVNNLDASHPFLTFDATVFADYHISRGIIYRGPHFGLLQAQRAVFRRSRW
jgi:phenylalanyl-tRNA synthetase alpha subunit